METSGVLTIGFAGKLRDQQKRASDLIEFCVEMEKVRVPYEVQIAGSGPEEERIREALEAHMFVGRLKHFGELTTEQMYEQFYPGLDVLLITSEWETGPIVAWEAMLHGVLILTSEYRGIKCEKIFQDNHNALIYPVGDMKKAVLCLSAYIGDWRRAREVAEQAREQACRYLTKQHMISGWDEVLEVVGNMPARKRRTSNHYQNPGELPYRIGAIGMYARWLLNRPIRHGGAHEEWPRYSLKDPGRANRNRFVAELDELEKAQCQSISGGQGRL